MGWWRIARCSATALVALSLISACSNGRGSVDGDAPPPTGEQQPPPNTPGLFSVGGSVSGLTGSGLVIQNNGASDLTITADGPFTFARALADAAPYQVTVLTQPAGQTCSVTNGLGTIHAGNVADVAIACSSGSTSHSIGGRVTSLVGSGLVLTNNGGDNLVVAPGDEDFTFATNLSPGASYNVQVLTQPSNPSQVCSIANGSGVVADTDVTSVSVVCSTEPHFIGGTVTGLAGDRVTLQNNGGDDLDVGGNGSFRFITPVASGSSYNVTVSRDPANPPQTCVPSNNAGTVLNADVSNVLITCTVGTFRVGGTVTGLAGRGLRARMTWLGGVSNANIPTNGSFQFDQALLTGTAYQITITSQPNRPTQTCAIVSGDTGIVANANIDSIAISCSTATFTVGGTVTGLQGTGLVLQNNGADALAIVSNGSFTFPTGLLSDRNYEVTVLTQPSQPPQDCTVANGRGRVGSDNVRDIRVTCAPRTFPVSGTISGLVGTGLTLQNNGGDQIEIQSGTEFAFPRPIASGAAYDVTVARGPINPSQACTVTNGTGTVVDAPITNVVITCTTSAFTVGGTVRGLVGAGLTLTNNGENLAVGTNGNFTFATPVASGAAYGVSVVTQPTGPTQQCTVTNGVGTVGDTNVTNINVDCVTTEITVGGSVSGLNGSGLVLQNNGTDNLSIAANGSFTFVNTLTTGAAYNITVLQQPSNPTQECTVINGSGTAANSNIQNVSVTCVNTMFTIGGSVSGLAGAGLVLNDGSEDLPVSADGAFSFPTQLRTGTPFNVTVRGQPTDPSQTCAVANGSGTVGTNDISNISVTCTTDTFPVSVRVQGINDVQIGFLVLQNNGGETVFTAVDGTLTFPTPVASGQPYNVTISQTPIAPAKTCTVDNGSGTVTDRPVTDVQVRCQNSDGGPGPGPGPR